MHTANARLLRLRIHCPSGSIRSMNQDWESLCRQQSTNWLHEVIGGDRSGPRLSAAQAELRRREGLAPRKLAALALCISAASLLISLLGLWRKWG